MWAVQDGSCVFRQLSESQLEEGMKIERLAAFGGSRLRGDVE